jgi:hypothetical protein
MAVANFYDEVLRPNNKHATGMELIEGELVDDETADIVTCNLETFNDYMRKVYRDWDAFMVYVDSRTCEYSNQWFDVMLGEGVSRA